MGLKSSLYIKVFFESFKSLQYLYLNDTKVTDAGLKHLSELKALKELGLSSTKVTDAGLKHLVGLKALESLDLRDTKVTDAGLLHLADLNALKKTQPPGHERHGLGPYTPCSSQVAQRTQPH